MKHCLGTTAGSDAHFSNEIGNAGIITTTETEDVREAIMKPLKNRHYILFFLILALLLYASIFLLKFEGLRSPDQMDYAQISKALIFTLIASSTGSTNIFPSPIFPV